ncbi:type I glyceraldehyde-3-phosphate dehydrogenase [Sanyastnella coralliicola]|uniref:type I glyceraldehyde-3-phosphate dehydrogenase n=1 Tax=Sanyastnella coralliicola TaxID=3069118 RepID=UPI0027BAE582|nr:type I glyceraldehyde-3-phosphate dehydrogenase [Longitalea sp. SCSIO 12813]
MKKVAINGFGRIGRLSLRQLLNKEGVDIVAVNDLTNVDVLAHLFKWDSIHGKFEGEISVDGNDLIINGDRIKVYSERNPENLPWAELGVDVVIESTGVFRDREGAGKHLTAGAKRVVISAPAKGDITTVVLGVNEEVLSPEDNIVSNASCTTNCLAPMVKVLNDTFGIEKGYITTIHAYTADQSIQDAPHSDLRRARAAALSMIPTSTGAASAVGKVLPEMKGKLDGRAVRVPTPDGSITDFTVILKKDVTVEEVNAAMKNAADGPLKGILEYTTEELVSVDIVGNTHSCIFDSSLTSANGNLVKVFGWYDNEAGYASRVADLVVKMG